MALPDETTKIVVSSAGKRPVDTPKALIPILDYMNGKAANNEFTKAIDEAIKNEKNIETERMSYMTYEMKLQEMQEAGYNRGKREGMLEGKFESRIESIRELMRNLNLSPEKAMKALGISPSEFSRYLTLL